MFSRFLPREEKFFDLFGELAEHIVEGAQENRKLLRDLTQSETRAQKLKEIEKRGDVVSHQAFAMLRSAFLTPLRRDDMHLLVGSMDTILDTIEATGQRVFLYDVRELPREAYQLADICVQCAGHVKAAVTGLEDRRALQPVLHACSEINRLENEADSLLRSALSDLFRHEPNTQRILKIKEVCDLLEQVTDSCDAVGSLVDRMILEEVS